MLTALQLQAEVLLRVGPMAGDAGLYAPDPTTGLVPAVAAGLRRGAAAVGIPLATPLAFADVDAANLTSYSAERVVREAERFVLGLVLLNWYLVLQKHREPIEDKPDLGGWLAEQRAGVRSRLAALDVELADPYREPSDPMVVVGRSGDFPRFVGDACLPAIPCWDRDRFPWAEGAYVPWSYWGGCP